MKKLIFLLSLAAILTSCITPSLPLANAESAKEMRRSARASKKLERLTNRFPELRRTDTIAAPISIRTPQVHGFITQPVPSRPGQVIFLPGEPVPYPLNNEPTSFTVDFEDSSLLARFTLLDGESSLDYTIKPMQVDTSAKVAVNTIQPVKFLPKPLTKLQTALMVLGGIFLLLILLYLIIKIMK